MTQPLIRERPEPVDGMVRRYRELKAQYVAIQNEMRALKEQMKYGICEVCGARFARMRPTKKVCSQRCNAKAYLARQANVRAFDIRQIAAALPVIEASHLMTPRTLDIVRDMVADDDAWTLETAAERHGLSRQRISQVLLKAQKLADMIALIRTTSAPAAEKGVNEEALV